MAAPYATKHRKASPPTQDAPPAAPPAGDVFHGWLRASPRSAWELHARAASYRACLFALRLEARRLGLSDMSVTEGGDPPAKR